MAIVKSPGKDLKYKLKPLSTIREPVILYVEGGGKKEGEVKAISDRLWGGEGLHFFSKEFRGSAN